MSSSRNGERRQFGRRASCLHAIAFIAGRGPVHCIVANLTPVGALLEFPDTCIPPFSFRLRIEAMDIELICNVKHEGRHGIGVLFVGGDLQKLATAACKPTDAPSVPEPVKQAPPQPTARTPDSSLRRQVFGEQTAGSASRPLAHVPGRVIRGV